MSNKFKKEKFIEVEDSLDLTKLPITHMLDQRWGGVMGWSFGTNYNQLRPNLGRLSSLSGEMRNLLFFKRKV